MVPLALDPRSMLFVFVFCLFVFLKAYGQQLEFLIFELKTLKQVLKQQNPLRKSILECLCCLEERNPSAAAQREASALARKALN